MAQNIKVEIVSPEARILTADASSVTVPGVDGYFTVMADHAALISSLKAGFVTVRSGEQQLLFYVRGGFAGICDGELAIMAEDARPGSEFDRSELEAAIQTAREALAEATGEREKQDAQSAVDGWQNLLLEIETGVLSN